MKNKLILITQFLLIVTLICSCDKEDDAIPQNAAILNIEPIEGTADTLVKITGKNFGNSKDGIIIEFNEETAEVVSVQPDLIEVRVPIDATTGKVTLTNDIGPIDGPIFKVIPEGPIEPEISELSPKKGSINTLVKIKGKNFIDPIEEITIKFNQRIAEIVSIEPNLIKVRVPKYATTGKITLTTETGSIDGPIFRIINKPIQSENTELNKEQEYSVIIIPETIDILGEKLNVASSNSNKFDSRNKNIDKSKKLIDTIAKEPKEQTLQFVYRDSLYQGTIDEINRKIKVLQSSVLFKNIPHYKKQELNKRMFDLYNERKRNLYKSNALTFLKELYKFSDFYKRYDQFIFEGIIKLQGDMNKLNISIEKDFVEAKVALDNHTLHKVDMKTYNASSTELKKELKQYEKAVDDGLGRLVAHQWMQPVILKYNTLQKVESPIDNYLVSFKHKEVAKVFELFEKDKKNEIAPYIMIRIIEFYFKESLKHTNRDKFQLNYIDKI